MAYNKNNKKYEAKEKLDPRQDLTDTIIKAMEEALKWEKDWVSSNIRPYNPVTGTVYSGINFLSLASRGYEDPRFYTGAQIQQLFKESEGKVHIRKGEKACRIMWAQPVSKESNEIDPETGEKKQDSGMMWKYYPVYNASQIEGIAPLPKSELQTEFKNVEEAELMARAMVEKTGLVIEHGKTNQPHYRPSTHSVGMPSKDSFKSVEGYYSTLMHEIGHATGHPKLLAREQKGRMHGSAEEVAAYAQEELVAELISVYSSHELGVPYSRKSHENSAAYLKSWIGALKNDKTYIFKASSLANKATDYMLGLKNELKKELGLDKKEELVAGNTVHREEEKQVASLKMKKQPALSM
ncbi:antirestriction protein-like protein [Caballeronia peredens]|nr:antirestriction protein-like protein [Caballeronia peredens]